MKVLGLLGPLELGVQSGSAAMGFVELQGSPSSSPTQTQECHISETSLTVTLWTPQEQLGLGGLEFKGFARSSGFSKRLSPPPPRRLRGIGSDGPGEDSVADPQQRLLLSQLRPVCRSFLFALHRFCCSLLLFGALHLFKGKPLCFLQKHTARIGLTKMHVKLAWGVGV